MKIKRVSFGKLTVKERQSLNNKANTVKREGFAMVNVVINEKEYQAIIQRFESGDLHETLNDEQGQLYKTFYHLAHTILANIEELKNVDTLHKELIANVSHDLRNLL